MRLDVDGRKRKGRLKRRWMNSVNLDLREKGLSGVDMKNRRLRRCLHLTVIDLTVNFA